MERQIHCVLSYYGSKYGSVPKSRNSTRRNPNFPPPKQKKKSRNQPVSGQILVAEAGLEPTTSGLWARRASNCSTPRCGEPLRFLSIIAWGCGFVNSFFARSLLWNARLLQRVGLSMMCYTLGKANRTSLGDFQLSGLMGKLLYWCSRIASCFT